MTRAFSATHRQMLGLYAKAQTDSVAADSAAATAAAPFRFIRAKQAALPAAPIRRPPPLRIAADFVQRQLPLRHPRGAEHDERFRHRTERQAGNVIARHMAPRAAAAAAIGAGAD